MNGGTLDPLTGSVHEAAPAGRAASYGRRRSAASHAWIIPLTLACAALFLLLSLSHHENPPQIQAALRFSPHGMDESVWRYTGPRPAPGEHLVAYVRKGNRWSYSRVTVVAYTAEPGGMPAEKPFFAASPSPKSYLGLGAVAIPDWPRDRDLYLGLQFREGQPEFWEQGEWPSAPFDSHTTQRRSMRDTWKVVEKSYFMSLDARVRPGSTQDIDFSTTMTLTAEEREAAGLTGPPPLVARSAGKRPAVVEEIPQGPPRGLLVAIAALFLLSGAAGALRFRASAAHWIFYHMFLVWILAQAVAVFWAQPMFWAGFHFQRIGVGWFVVGVGLLLVATFPPVVAILHRRTTALWRPSRALLGVSWIRRCALAGVALAAVFAFWKFPCRTLYGDGFTALPAYDYHNPFATQIYYVYFIYGKKLLPWIGAHIGHPELALPLSYAGFASAIPFNLAFSPLYVLGAWLIAAAVGRVPRERLLLWGILLSLKIVLCQFSYIEVYPTATAVSMIALAAIVRAMWRNGEPLWAGMASYAAFLFHLAFAPAVALCAALGLRGAWANWRRPSWAFSRLFAIAAFVFMNWMLVVAGLFILKYEYNSEPWCRYLPGKGFGMLYGETGVPATVAFLQSDPARIAVAHEYLRGSVEHFAEWGNAILFTFGAPVLFLVAAILFAPFRIFRSIRLLGAVLSGGGALLASYVLANHFAQPKDWDLFATNALIVAVCALCVLVRGRMLPSHALRWALWSLLCYQLVDTGLWIYYNVTWGPPAAEKYFMCV